MFITKSFVFIIVLLIIYGCSFEKTPPESFVEGIRKIQQARVPDQRTEVFSVDYFYEDGLWLIRGESSVAKAMDDVEALVKETFADDKVELDLQDLPLLAFGDTTHALVNVSVGNLRRSPKHSAEMVDQVLMGMELKLLKTMSYWYLVQTPSNYIGWITRGTIKRLDDENYNKWLKSDRYTLTINFDQTFSQASDKSQVVSDLVLGSVFEKISTRGNWTEIQLPDGRIGFVKTRNITAYAEPENNPQLDRRAVIECAKKMMGIPYLWGGHSTKGLDCSGFTSTVFRSEGYQLPRDANMQVEQGEEIVPEEDFSNILAGDLIFFGPPNRITHVGICLGGSYFIHASDDVHVNSLDEKDALFNPYRKKTFQRIKRIIKN